MPTSILPPDPSANDSVNVQLSSPAKQSLPGIMGPQSDYIRQNNKERAALEKLDQEDGPGSGGEHMDGWRPSAHPSQK